MSEATNRAPVCLPVSDWPERDRRAWQKVREPATDVLAIEGTASHLRFNTVRTMESAYGRWIAFSCSHEDLDPALSPGARVTEARLRAYIDELQAQIASTTLANRIRDLDSMIGQS